MYENRPLVTLNSIAKLILKNRLQEEGLSTPPASRKRDRPGQRQATLVEMLTGTKRRKTS
jgi:hypothetical protein